VPSCTDVRARHPGGRVRRVLRRGG
jgi:hypothetical protein